MVPANPQQATQQVAQENEQFALAWLRSTFELSGGARTEQGELYKQYINSCAKIGRRGVIAPLHFPRCVRFVSWLNVFILFLYPILVYFTYPSVSHVIQVKVLVCFNGLIPLHCLSLCELKNLWRHRTVGMYVYLNSMTYTRGLW